MFKNIGHHWTTLDKTLISNKKLPEIELIDARSQFLALPAVIRAAMKRAADAEVWTPETWRVEVALATEILDLDESASAADNLARLYENAAGGQETLL